MNNNEFARRLRDRIESDPTLTEAGLSVAAGLDNSTIRNILTGKSRNQRLDTMEKICAALGTTVDQFMAPAQSDEEREIVRLVLLLPAPLRRQLLGYAEALAVSLDPAPPKSPEEDQ